MTCDYLAWPGRCQRSRRETAILVGGISPTEVAVLYALIDRGARAGYCFVSYKTLGRDTKLSTRTIQRVIHSLISLGWIRACRARRNNGTLGSYHYFLLIVGTVKAPSSRLSDQSPVATESALNIKNKHVDSGALKKSIELEQEVFEALRSSIDLHAHPHMINGTRLTDWLHSRLEYDFDQLRRFVLDETARFQDRLKTSKSTLSSWEHFLDHLNQRAEWAGKPFVACRVHPTVEQRIHAYLRKARLASQRRNQDNLDIRSEDGVVQLSIGSRLEFERICEKTTALKGLANSIELPICVKFDSKRDQVHYPKSFG